METLTATAAEDTIIETLPFPIIQSAHIFFKSIIKSLKQEYFQATANIFGKFRQLKININFFIDSMDL